MLLEIQRPEAYMAAIVERVHSIPILASCGLSDLAQVERLTERRRFSAGEEILAEGETDQALWMLLSGRCEVVKCSNGGGEQQLAVVEPGGIFGEMSFLKPAPHSATVRALTDVEVAVLSPNGFQSLRDESPAAANCIIVHLVSLLSERLRRMDERICEVLGHTSADRQQEWHDFRARLFAGWDFN